MQSTENITQINSASVDLNFHEGNKTFPYQKCSDEFILECNHMQIGLTHFSFITIQNKQWESWRTSVIPIFRGQGRDEAG